MQREKRVLVQYAHHTFGRRRIQGDIQLGLTRKGRLNYTRNRGGLRRDFMIVLAEMHSDVAYHGLRVEPGRVELVVSRRGVAARVVEDDAQVHGLAGQHSQLGRLALLDGAPLEHLLLVDKDAALGRARRTWFGREGHNSDDEER